MMNIFVLNMKKYRKKRGLSQMKLAEIINTSTSYIGEIEINKKVPSMDMVEKIANALDVEPFRLFLDDNIKNSENILILDNYLSSLTIKEKQELAKHIISLVTNDIEEILENSQK
jgi:transcriptional regulator with XRE-family HTH domain